MKVKKGQHFIEMPSLPQKPQKRLNFICCNEKKILKCSFNPRKFDKLTLQRT